MTAANPAGVATRYVGRRTVLVVGGDAAAPARELAEPLLTAGVELHVVAGAGATARFSGVASWNVCDLGSAAAIDAAIARIGAVVQNVFHTDARAEAFAAVTVAVKPLMLVGGSIVAAGEPGGEVAQFVADHAPAYLEAGVRLLVATIGSALEAAAPGLA